MAGHAGQGSGGAGSQGSKARPGNRRVVHHSIMYLDASGVAEVK